MADVPLWIAALAWLTGIGTGALFLAIHQHHSKYRRCQNCDWPIRRKQFHDHAKECIR